MNIENEKRFYIDFSNIKMCYPKEVSKRVQNFGVLEQYKDKKYTLKEMNQIIAEILMKTPFISKSMFIKISVLNGMGYHHILNFRNYQYEKQTRTDGETLDFLYVEAE